MCVREFLDARQHRHQGPLGPVRRARSAGGRTDPTMPPVENGGKLLGSASARRCLRPQVSAGYPDVECGHTRISEFAAFEQRAAVRAEPRHSADNAISDAARRYGSDSGEDALPALFGQGTQRGARPPAFSDPRRCRRVYGLDFVDALVALGCRGACIIGTRDTSSTSSP